MRQLDFGFDDLVPHEPRARAWTPVSPLTLGLSLVFFGLFLYALARDMEIAHLVERPFMLIHACGHALFRVFGLTAAVAGGTFLQVFIPFALGLYFIRQRRSLAVAFCMFFFFEQFLPVGRYMADAQAQQLPWFTIGRYESVIHDWNYLFTKLGALSYDTLIADVVRSIGSLGMIVVAFWLLWRGLNDIAQSG